MRARTITICVLAGAILLAGGYAAATGALAGSPRDAFTVACDGGTPRDGTPVTKTIDVSVAETFTVSLCSNPSTGYSWADPTIGSGAIVLVGRSSVAPSGDLVGAAGTEVFTFRAVSAGTTTLAFSYGQPWPGGEQDAVVVQLIVTAG